MRKGVDQAWSGETKLLWRGLDVDFLVEKLANLALEVPKAPAPVREGLGSRTGMLAAMMCISLLRGTHHADKHCD